MLIYEKNNKLNINFDPSKSIEGTPDIQIGENEIKLGDAEITSENVLPTPTNEDVGKVPTVQEDGMYSLENIPSELPVATPGDVGKAIIVDENGGYTLAEAGGGANVLMLYSNILNDATDVWLYKDGACTQKYTTMWSAQKAVRNADIIKIRYMKNASGTFYYVTIGAFFLEVNGNYSQQVSIVADAPTITGYVPNITITLEKKQFTLYSYRD